MNRLIVALTFLVAATAQADFNSLVRFVESQPRLQRVWTPGISLVRFGVQLIHPEGVHDFELAVFEGDGHLDRSDFAEILRSSNEKPMVQVHSRNGETAVVWARPMGGRLVELVVLAHEPDDNTVVFRAVVDGEKLAQQISDPRHPLRITQR